MENLYSILLLPAAPIIALLVDTVIKHKLPRKIIASLALICCLIAAPLLLTKYSYGGFYSYWIVIAIIAAILLFAGFNYLDMSTWLKILTALAFMGISLVPVGLTFFARGFVGDDKIYDNLKIPGYRIIYRQEADAVLTGPLKVELYKTLLFGLLQKEIDVKYVDQNNSPCAVELSDASKNKIIHYDPCSESLKK
jgi:hypothetical protein